MKREQIKKNKKKAGKRHKNLILLSLLALALTAGWYVFTTPSGKLLDTGAWFAAETDKSDTFRLLRRNTAMKRSMQPVIISMCIIFWIHWRKCQTAGFR